MRRLLDWLHFGPRHVHVQDHGGWEDLMCGCECYCIEEAANV